MVTAETAVVLPVLLLVLALGLSAIGHVLDVVRVTDAARSGARMAARGDDDAQVRAAAFRGIDPAATVTITRSSTTVVVSVRQPGDPVLAGLRVVGLHWPAATAAATALVEQ